MNITRRTNSYICTRRRYRLSPLLPQLCQNDSSSRGLAHSTDSPQETAKDDEESKSTSDVNGQGQAEGRMSQRLVHMTDEMIEQDGRSAKKIIEEGGFSEELKRKLEARLQQSSFRSGNAAAFAQASLPVRSTHLLTGQVSGIYNSLVQRRQRNPKYCCCRTLGRH